MRKPKLEVLPSPAELALAPVQRAALDRLVAQKVAEIVASREWFVWEPFFRSRQVAYELKRLQTVSEQQKWSVYFERWGCLVCQTTERIHVGNGHCSQCYPRTHGRLKGIVAEGIKGPLPLGRALLQSPKPRKDGGR